MKRITWWPQAWLGIVFSWGALVGGGAVLGELALPTLLLYAGSVAWVIGYDTIYACQDVQDDALIGVRSSALRLGARVRGGVAVFYMLAILLWAGAFWTLRPEPLALVALAPAACHLIWQVVALDPDDASDALAKFRSNRFAGLLVALACAAVGSA
jgi:4-hydroxybenzoate polyprenyltransferase